MCHKNDSPNLTKKSSDLLKDWWSICLSYFFSCFNSWKAEGIYRGYFPAIYRLCFFFYFSDLKNHNCFFLLFREEGKRKVVHLMKTFKFGKELKKLGKLAILEKIAK